ncbi:MAG: peptidoglycan-binding protein [Clostridia bacterium]|nr:peptidoglycan-binding protein [Clostridia bacterium]
MNTKRMTKIIAFLIALVLVLSLVATALAYSTIPYGSQGDDVRKMQTVLRQKGFYKGRVDGKFGPATRKAVIAFQKSVSITADGKPGNRTLTALYEGSSAINHDANGDVKAALNIKDPRSIYYGMKGDRVRSLQQALRKAGYYNAAIDGKFGDNTRNAVLRFQRDHGLYADGIAGVKTQNKLNAVNGGKAKISDSFVLGLGSECPEVRSLQSYLCHNGFGPITDKEGYFGESTRDALIMWQVSTNRSTTGTMTESTYNNTVAKP